MIPRTLIGGCGLVALLLSQGVLAQFDLQELIKLQRGNADAAYAYAEQYRADQEGDPAFDFYYGMAAIDSGNASQGVFSLERVLAVQPNNHAARLELARGYFILEEYERSRNEFNTALQANPPPIVRQRIERFMDAIRLKEGRYRTSGNGYAQFGIGNDTNVNSAPGDDIIMIGPTQVELDEDSVETEDSFVTMVVAGRVDKPLTTTTGLFFSGIGDIKAHASEDQFDNHTLTLRGGGTMRRGDDRYELDLQYQSFVFDGDDFRDLIGVNANWRRRTSERSQFSVFGQLASQEYPDQEDRDSTVLIAGAGYTGQLSGRLAPVWFVNGYLGQEDPDGSTPEAEGVADRSFLGLRTGTQLNLNHRATLLLALSAQRSEYAGEDVSAGEKRDDDFLALDIDYTWLINKTISARANLSASDNSSNIELYDFKRTVAGVSLRAEFN